MDVEVTSGDSAFDEAQGHGARPGSTPEAPGPRKAWRRYVVIALVLTVGAYFGWHWLQERRNYETTDNAALEGDLLPVTSQVEGVISKLTLQENDPVKAGDILLEIDSRPFDIALKEAEAKLAVARRRAEALKAGISLSATQAKAQATQASGGVGQASADISAAEALLSAAEHDVSSRQAALRQAKTEFDLASAEYARFAELSSKGYVSPQELDVESRKLSVAQTAVDTAQQQLDQAEAKVAEERAGVAQAKAKKVTSGGQVQNAEAARIATEVTSADYQTALAEVEVSQAAVDKARLDVERCKIRALADGTVGRKAVAPGQQINPGQILLAIVRPKVWVTANFKETQMARLHPGQEVELTVDALPGVKFSGKLASFSPASGSTFALIPPENATGNFTKVVQRVPVRIELDQEELQQHADQLSPGMSVIAKVKVH